MPEDTHEPKESPFGEGSDSKNNACVGRNGGSYFYADYCASYFDGAEALAQRAFSQESLIDRIIYPAMFSYRQALELSLKNLIRWKEKRTVGTHNLDELLRRFLLAERELENKLSEEDRSLICSFVKKFHRIDPSGEAFRFPEDKNGKLFLQEIQYLNIEPVFLDMKKIRQATEELFSRNF